MLSHPFGQQRGKEWAPGNSFLQERAGGLGANSVLLQMQMQPPGGVAEDLVRNALGFRGAASNADACPG